MLISVIIPTYNEEKNIGGCLESLSHQSLKDFEIIVVDDGSTDKTLEILSNFNVQVLKQRHMGPATARNLAAKHAKGKILVFVDADMTFHPDFIKNLTKPILEKKTTGTFSKEEYVKNWDNTWARCWNINQNLPNRKRLPLNYPDHQKVFRAILKTQFDRVGGFSKGGYTDDYTLSQKLGVEAQSAPNAVFYHNNPDTLSDVYHQARWVAKREYKLGSLGIIFTLLKSSLPISLLIGTYKSIRHSKYSFLSFKVIYDLGIFIGLLNYWITGNSAK